jgi:hypothetical protein
MYLYDVSKHLERRRGERGLIYRLGLPAGDDNIGLNEQRLEVSVPAQVKQFYLHYNGLHLDQPALDILPLADLDFVAPGSLHFATVDNIHRLCFDTTHLNTRFQWNIIAIESGYWVTLTMASFWSNKIWAWIDKNRPIWQPWP